MRDYLTAMDQLSDRYRAVRASTTIRMIGALGPRMLHLAATHTDGAHTYLVPPEHTATARQILGPGKLLVPEQAVILDSDKTRARDTARRHVRRYLPLTNYTDNLRRLGFDTADFEHDGSDRLIDALVAWGDEAAIAERLAQHRQAGADHVCIQVLDADPRGLPSHNGDASPPSTTVPCTDASCSSDSKSDAIAAASTLSCTTRSSSPVGFTVQVSAAVAYVGTATTTAVSSTRLPSFIRFMPITLAPTTLPDTPATLPIPGWANPNARVGVRADLPASVGGALLMRLARRV